MPLRLGLAGPLALGFVCATTQLAFAAPNCGRDIANLGALEGVPIILLGELHGLEGIPVFAIDLACRLASSGKPVLLALEIPRQEQARIDVFLASKGGAADEAALLDGAFWRRVFQDGRSSRARVAMLEAARKLRADGMPLRIAAVDDASVPPTARDEAMASGLLAARKPGETALLLAGDLHARTKPGAPWDPKIVWAGVLLRAKEPKLVSLVNRFLSGSAWLCMSNDATGCGIKSVKGAGVAAGFRIERFAATDSIGHDGVFEIGPATASIPAREDMRPRKN